LSSVSLGHDGASCFQRISAITKKLLKSFAAAALARS